MACVLDQPTLVLNRNWAAVAVDSVREAISKVCAGNASVLDPDAFQTYSWDDWSVLKVREGDDFVASPRGVHRVPDIIILTRYEKTHSKALIFNRRNLFIRDDNTCQYCGKRMKTSECTIDHVVPTCQGGEHNWANCVLACVDCNIGKGGRTPRQAGMRLVRQPFKPKWNQIFRTKLIKPVWGKVLDINSVISEMYWQVEMG